LLIFLSFLNALPVSSSILLSAAMQRPRTEDPALHRATVSFKMAEKKMVVFQICPQGGRQKCPQKLTVYNLSCHLVLCYYEVVGDGGHITFLLGFSHFA
jgi:hypothetical protein